MSTYRHHFDLFVKGNYLLLGAMGAVASFSYAGSITRSVQLVLAYGLILVAGLGIAGCSVSMRWVDDMKSQVDPLSDELGVQRFPFSGARGIAKTFCTMSWIALVLACCNAIALSVAT